MCSPISWWESVYLHSKNEDWNGCAFVSCFVSLRAVTQASLLCGWRRKGSWGGDLSQVSPLKEREVLHCACEWAAAGFHGRDNNSTEQITAFCGLYSQCRVGWVLISGQTSGLTEAVNTFTGGLRLKHEDVVDRSLTELDGEEHRCLRCSWICERDHFTANEKGRQTQNDDKDQEKNNFKLLLVVWWQLPEQNHY